MTYVKRKLGVKTYNISQGAGGGYSHKDNQGNALYHYDWNSGDTGIDSIYAFYPFEVIGVHTIEKTGFSNTVHFYDSENDVTVAMTHDNAISDMYVGKVLSIGEKMYDEGTAGNATGNHVHFEMAKGKITGKTKINGVWTMYNLIPIEDYWYLDTTYTTIKETKGHDLELREGEQIVVNLGHNELSTLVTYIQKDNEVPFYRCDNLDPKYMSAITTNGDETSVMNRVNGGRFINELGNEYGQILHRWQGIDANLNRIDARNDGSAYSLVVNNGYLDIGKFQSWDYPDAEIGILVDFVLVRNGDDVDWYSEDFMYDGALDRSYYYTYIGQLKNGKMFDGITKVQMTPAQIRTDLKAAGLEIENLVVIDGGGSCHYIAYTPSKVEKNYDGENRKVPCAFGFMVDNRVPTPEPEPEKPTYEELEAEIIQLKEDFKASENNVEVGLGIIGTLTDKVAELDLIIASNESVIKEHKALNERLTINILELKDTIYEKEKALQELDSVESHSAISLIVLGIKKLF